MSSLYIVSTPIGNLNDISKRAIEVLSDVEIICVEDTRVSKKLLNRYKISNKMIVYNNFNESRQCDKILDYLTQGKDVALISDAGTPCISDPGYLLVNKCRKNNIDVDESLMEFQPSSQQSKARYHSLQSITPGKSRQTKRENHIKLLP